MTTDRAERSTACVFCRIIAGSEPGEVVWDDDVAVGILDRRPLFHGHVLVVPRRHVVTLADLDPSQVGPFFRRVRAMAAELPEAIGCEGSFVANNNIVSQSVAHLHVHVVPRVKGDGLRGFFWPRTTYADGEIEVVGARLREAFGRVPPSDIGSTETD
ncbi:HIT family protein [Ilumatobacter nonamiensis]|uniref:HIT family protein n=1 Tax=Ilumatobacter nonamiensis TaxID=467093 RepID=UPI00034A95E9|nr:HIT family protein [Ilumatobacter nonamiensis]